MASAASTLKFRANTQGINLSFGLDRALDVPTIYYNSQCFKKLLELWQILSDLPDGSLNITFRFSKCKFLAHNGVAFLGGLAHYIEVRGGSYNFDWDSLAPKIKMNLAQNGFLKEFGHGEVPWDGNSIPYRRVIIHSPPCKIAETPDFSLRARGDVNGYIVGIW